MEEPRDVKGKVILIVRVFRCYDPWDVEGTEVGRDTVTNGVLSVILYKHSRKTYTSVL